MVLYQKKMVWYYQIWVGLIECIVLWPPKKLLKCSVKKQATSPCFFFFKSRLGIALWGRGCETIRPRPWHSLLTKMQRVFFESFVGRITALLFSFFLSFPFSLLAVSWQPMFLVKTQAFSTVVLLWHQLRTGGITVSNYDNSFNGFLVSKETVVLCRWESETKSGFYQTSWLRLNYHRESLRKLTLRALALRYSLRRQMLFLWQLLIEMLGLFFLTYLTSGRCF